MDHFPLAGALLDYVLALPFAIALAIHNQTFRRPSFHIAAVFAATPLLASMIQKSAGLDLLTTLLVTGLVAMAGSILLEVLTASLSRHAPGQSNARAFFLSTTIYLLALQLLLMTFGASPRSLEFDSTQTTNALGLVISPTVLAMHAACAALAIIVIVVFDGRSGARLRLSAGGNLDAVLVGVGQRRLQLLAGVLIALLVAVAALARGVALPASVYSGFPVFILCFCASALPAGTRLSATAMLLLIIYVVRAGAAYYVSAQLADAVTLSFALLVLTVFLSATSLRARGAHP